MPAITASGLPNKLVRAENGIAYASRDDVFFARSPSSRQAGEEAMRRMYARTEDRDTAPEAFLSSPQ